MQKKDFLLNVMINEYIRIGCLPIGSESLKEQLSPNMKISSATIRNYFKILCDEGLIIQTHLSSGRIPTAVALRNFWQENLNPNELNPSLDSVNLDYLCNEFGLTCVLKEIKFDQKLKKVIKLENLAIILMFENESLGLNFQASLARFCEELVGLKISEILKIANEVRAINLKNALENINKSRVYFFGVEFLADLLKESPSFALNLIQGEVFYGLNNGFSFPENSEYMTISHNATFKNKPSKMLCVGKLQRDYARFYSKIA